MHGPKPVSQTQVDVVEESGAVRSVVLVGIESLHDIPLSGLPVLRNRRKAAQVDQQVLRPVLNILLRRPVCVSADPTAHVMGKALVKFTEISWYDEPIVPNIAPVGNRERIAFRFFAGKTGKIPGYHSIRMYGDTSFRKDLNCMRSSLRGREELAVRVQQALMLSTKKEAEHIVNVVIGSLEATLLNNLGTDGFSLKLGGFGKFSVRHKPGILRFLSQERQS